jgi:hypothetical protein
MKFAALLVLMYICVDNLIKGGANLTIEIQRVALRKLSEILEADGLQMPRELNFQFDNCGENKVRKKSKRILLYNYLVITNPYPNQNKRNVLLLRIPCRISLRRHG